jgi:hypothetical protein
MPTLPEFQPINSLTTYPPSPHLSRPSSSEDLQAALPQEMLVNIRQQIKRAQKRVQMPGIVYTRGDSEKRQSMPERVQMPGAVYTRGDSEFKRHPMPGRVMPRGIQPNCAKKPESEVDPRLEDTVSAAQDLAVASQLCQSTIKPANGDARKLINHQHKYSQLETIYREAGRVSESARAVGHHQVGEYQESGDQIEPET